MTAATRTTQVGKVRAVYQIVTHASNGQQQRWTPLYLNRAQAKLAASAHEDRDPEYAYMGGRWSVDIERLPVAELP